MVGSHPTNPNDDPDYTPITKIRWTCKLCKTSGLHVSFDYKNAFTTWL